MLNTPSMSLEAAMANCSEMNLLHDSGTNMTKSSCVGLVQVGNGYATCWKESHFNASENIAVDNLLLNGFVSTEQLSVCAKPVLFKPVLPTPARTQQWLEQYTFPAEARMV